MAKQTAGHSEPTLSYRLVSRHSGSDEDALRDTRVGPIQDSCRVYREKMNEAVNVSHRSTVNHSLYAVTRVEDCGSLSEATV